MLFGSSLLTSPTEPLLCSSRDIIQSVVILISVERAEYHYKAGKCRTKQQRLPDKLFVRVILFGVTTINHAIDHNMKPFKLPSQPWLDVAFVLPDNLRGELENLKQRTIVSRTRLTMKGRTKQIKKGRICLHLTLSDSINVSVLISCITIQSTLRYHFIVVDDSSNSSCIPQS